MALAVQSGPGLAEQVDSGGFIRATPLQILVDEKHLLENQAGFETIYWGDHANGIGASRGRLPEAQTRFLRKIDHAIANHPVTEQEVRVTSPW
jgi:hypothetical protein